jgi:Ni/Co efflux regulator RcnB
MVATSGPVAAQPQGAHGPGGGGWSHGQGGPTGGHAGPQSTGAHTQGGYQGGTPRGGGSPQVGPRSGSATIFHGYDARDVQPGQAYRGDRRGFGQNYQAGRRFSIGAYNRPDGWYSHRWRTGEILPRLFWSRDYWLLDYWLYSLSPPPYGYVWVRDGADALLINQYTGEVVEVVYGAFY